MGWKSRLVTGAMALAVVGGSFVYGTQVAGAAGVNGTGAVGTCGTMGTFKFKPPRLATATTTSDTISISSAGSGGGCTGATGDGLHVTGSKSKGSQTTNSNACVGSTPTSTLKLVVKWTTDGTVKLNPSTITVTSSTLGATPDGHEMVTSSGSVTAGSFNGDTFTSSVKSDQTITTLTAECKGKGLKSVTYGIAAGSDGIKGSGTSTIS